MATAAAVAHEQILERIIEKPPSLEKSRRL